MKNVAWRPIALTGLLFAATLLTLAGCSSTKVDAPDTAVETGPDLVPVLNSVQYCDRDESGNLLIQVKNQGGETAKESTTTVTFGTEPIWTEPTKSLTSNESAPKESISMELASWNPDADFTITVDAENVVHELNESNNVARGKCIG